MALGLGLFGGYSSSSTNTSSNETGSQANTYSAGQSGLQDRIMQFLSSMLPGMQGGTMSPDVQALKTQSANSINQNYQGAGDTLNAKLAARGFGKSGSVGKAALSTEMARQAALAGNEANFSGLQLQQNNTLLSDALAAAFQSLGYSFNDAKTGTSSSSGWSIGSGAKFGV